MLFTYLLTYLFIYLFIYVFFFLVPSDPPGSVRVLSPDTSTITVSWTQIRKDSLNGILQGYMVFYRIFDVGNYSKITVGPSVLQATINDSLSYTDVYEVRVAGITRAGVGVKSNPLSFRPGKSLNRPELLEVRIYVNVKMTE